MREINKNIVTVQEGIIAHGVNCQKRMNSGVARAIRARWPIVYEKYLSTNPTLGFVDFLPIKNNLIVANCYTQKYYGSDGRRYASISAIENCMDTVIRYAAFLGLNVYIPRIGCGLGGLNWEEVKPIIKAIEEFYISSEVIVCSI